MGNRLKKLFHRCSRWFIPLVLRLQLEDETQMFFSEPQNNKIELLPMTLVVTRSNEQFRNGMAKLNLAPGFSFTAINYKTCSRAAFKSLQVFGQKGCTNLPNQVSFLFEIHVAQQVGRIISTWNVKEREMLNEEFDACRQKEPQEWATNSSLKHEVEKSMPERQRVTYFIFKEESISVFTSVREVP